MNTDPKFTYLNRKFIPMPVLPEEDAGALRALLAEVLPEIEAEEETPKTDPLVSAGEQQ